VALRSSHLVIHFLTADDLPLAELFGTQSGDTVCLTTEPVAAQTAGPFRPLRLSQAGHLKAGHSAEERPEPPQNGQHQPDRHHCP
jgi:hypothetical protein